MPQSTVPIAIGNNDLLRVGGMLGIRRLLRRYGADPKDTLARFDIDIGLLDDPDAYVSYSSFAHLLEWCAEQFNADFFGLELVQFQSAHILGPVAFMIEAATTVAEGLELLVRYVRHHSSTVISSIKIADNLCELGFDLRLEEIRGKRQINELSLGVGIHILRAFCGQGFHSDKIFLACKPPASNSGFARQFFNCELIYNSETSMFIFDEAVLRRRLPSSNATLQAILQSHLDRLSPPGDTSLVQRVRQAIRDFLPLGQATIDNVSGIIGLHPRLLQTALKHEGIEFRQLLGEVRHSLARSYLIDTEMPVAEIAYQLGYSDQTSFTRAFRGWTTMSPALFRKTNR